MILNIFGREKHAPVSVDLLTSSNVKLGKENLQYMAGLEIHSL